MRTLDKSDNQINALVDHIMIDVDDYICRMETRHEDMSDKHILEWKRQMCRQKGMFNKPEGISV